MYITSTHHCIGGSLWSNITTKRHEKHPEWKGKK